MPHYARYTTKVVGAHSLPRRHEAPGRLESPNVDSGTLMTDRRKARSQAAPPQALLSGWRGLDHPPRRVA